MNKTKLILIPSLAFTAIVLLTAANKNHAPWSYEGANGPEHWGDLDDAYALCKTGKQQSPIDIREVHGEIGAPLEFHYGESKVNLINNGHTIQQNLDSGCYVIYNDKRFDALQFHFHHGSEHTIDGHQYAMEMHIVHAAKDGELLVVGTLLKAGAKNAFLNQFWSKMPKNAGGTYVDESTKIDLGDWIPENSDVYSYDGSAHDAPWNGRRELVPLHRASTDRRAAKLGLPRPPSKQLSSDSASEWPSGEGVEPKGRLVHS